MPFDRAADKESRWRRFLYCMQTPRDLAESLCVLALLVGGGGALPDCSIPNWGSAASRCWPPGSSCPRSDRSKILRVTPGDTDVLVGTSVEVAAEIDNPHGKPYRAVLLVTPDGEPESQLPMTADETQQRYKADHSLGLKPLSYRLEIGDSQTPVYTVGVREKPVVEAVEVTFHYPAYLGRKSETFDQKGLDLEAPQYTVAELRLRPRRRWPRVISSRRANAFAGRVEEGGNLLVASHALVEQRLVQRAAVRTTPATATRIRG